MVHWLAAGISNTSTTHRYSTLRPSQCLLPLHIESTGTCLLQGSPGEGTLEIEFQLDSRKNPSKMDSQLARCEGAPSSICESCSNKTPQMGYFRAALSRDKKRGPHVTWHQRRNLKPQTRSRMAGCLVCSTLMDTVHRHEGDLDYDDVFELSVLPSRRATKKPGGYDWEDCPLISLLPATEFHHYSSPSGCTDFGFLAMVKAQDGGQGAPTEAKRALDFEYIRELVSVCTEQHGARCSSTLGPRVPNLRVIDCTTGSVVDAPEDCCYLALSYVWGKASTSTTDDRGTEFKQVVRDGIDITKSLGFQYLWVDRHVGAFYFSHYCHDLR